MKIDIAKWQREAMGQPQTPDEGKILALINEIVRLRSALLQVIVDCEDAGNLSYAAKTARDALA